MFFFFPLCTASCYSQDFYQGPLLAYEPYFDTLGYPVFNKYIPLAASATLLLASS
jgi:hypothetical protein